MVSAFSLEIDVPALLARCGTVAFCVILAVPLIGERADADAPAARERVAAAAADEWRATSERPVPARAASAPAPEPASPEPATPEAPPPVALVMADLVALEPEAPRAAPAPRSAAPPVPVATAVARLATAAPAAATGGGTLVLASWYGPGFYGNRTACGQTYTAQLQGVASPSLPCGTVVTLTYGGRTVSVPVIDRGPFVGGRTLDLSNATRLALGCPDLCSLLLRVGD